MILTPWILLHSAFDGEVYISGATRIRKGGDVQCISDRYAFIEKTPRVRIRSGTNNGQWEDFLNWAGGDSGNGPTDIISRHWCDSVLRALGHDLE